MEFEVIKFYEYFSRVIYYIWNIGSLKIIIEVLIFIKINVFIFFHYKDFCEIVILMIQ